MEITELLEGPQKKEKQKETTGKKEAPVGTFGNQTNKKTNKQPRNRLMKHDDGKKHLCCVAGTFGTQATIKQTMQ